MGKLDGRVAIITGAAGGQGEATARLFAEEGALVVLADVLEEQGRAVASDIGGNALFRVLDVASEQGWDDCVKAALGRWGRIDVLINNAGVVHAASIFDLKRTDFERVLGINLIGAWLGIKATAPSMISLGKGAIINISSTAGLWGMNGLAAYTSSKWALRGLTKTAAMELGHRGVRVNAIFPGIINTRMGNSISRESVEEQNRRYAKQAIPRIGNPDEVAKTSLFLVSDDASYLCGSEFVVDGGMTLGVYSDFLPGAPASA